MRKILTFLFILLLTSCSDDTSSSSRHIRHDYQEVGDISISYLDVFNIEHDRYYIYYYQETCYHCIGMKSAVIEYALNSEIPFYFVRIEKDEGFISKTVEETIGTNDPMYAFCRMTPQLSLVENGYITYTIIGEEILLIIE